MKKVLIAFCVLFAFSTVYANDKKMTSDNMSKGKPAVENTIKKDEMGTAKTATGSTSSVSKEGDMLKKNDMMDNATGVKKDDKKPVEKKSGAVK